MGRQARTLLIVVAVIVLVVCVWVGWELYRGPTTTRRLSAGDVLPIASNLGTVTVPPGWSGQVTAVRSDPVAWLQFKASHTLSRQVIELRLPDGSVDLILDVTRGPGAYRARLDRAEAEAKKRRSNPYAGQMIQSDSGSDGGFGGRKSLALGNLERVRDSWASTLTLFIWDRSAPFIMVVRDSRPPDTSSPESSASLTGMRAFAFAAAGK